MKNNPSKPILRRKTLDKLKRAFKKLEVRKYEFKAGLWKEMKSTPQKQKKRLKTNRKPLKCPSCQGLGTVISRYGQIRFCRRCSGGNLGIGSVKR